MTIKSDTEQYLQFLRCFERAFIARIAAYDSQHNPPSATFFEQWESGSVCQLTWGPVDLGTS